MAAPLTMREAAAEMGWCYDVFRKRWRELAADRGFPEPFVGKKWDADAIAAWKLRQSERRASPRATPAAANDAHANAFSQLEALWRA